MPSPEDPESWWRKRWYVWLIGALMVVAGVVLLVLYPTSSVRDLTIGALWGAGTSLVLTEVASNTELEKLSSRIRDLTGAQRSLQEGQAMATILSHASSDAMRERRKRVVQERAAFASGTASPQLLSDLQEVLVAYDRLGFLVHDNPRLHDRVLAWLGESIADYWEIGKPFVESRRKAGRSQYVRLLEAMAEEYRENKAYYEQLAADIHKELRSHGAG